MIAAHDYSDLHQLIDRLESSQAAELREHAFRLVGSASRFQCSGRSRVPPQTSRRAKELVRADLG